MITRFLALCCLAALLGCSSRATRPTAARGAQVDPTVHIAPDSLYPYQPGVDVEHYDFRITLPARGKRIEGQATIYALRRLSVDTLRLDLVGMEVTRVLVNTEPRRFRRDSTRIHIPLERGDTEGIEVQVRWAGEPSDGLIIREDSLRGWSAFGDNWPNRGRHWLPLNDHPSDKATVRWNVVAPQKFAVVANGTQLERVRTSRSGFSESRFLMRQPIPTYLMVIGVAEMQETELGNTACGMGFDGGCVPQSVWTFAPETSYAPGPFTEAGAMVEYFGRTIGPYAYDRLDHVQSATRFGGMENATVIFYSDQAFRNRNVGVSLIAHETAHQWFGDAVTPRAWQHLWVSEGFATYWAALYVRASRGDSAFTSEMRAIRDRIIDDDVVAQRPVVDSVGAREPLTLLNANSYQKGAFVLHMLRAHVGDSAFFRAMRAYRQRYLHGTATTDNFREAVELQHGASLQAFFEQWLHRPGWAELSLRWRWNAETKTITIDVTQGTRFPPFAVPLSLVFYDAAGAKARVQAQIGATSSQTLSLPALGIGTPVRVEADPEVLLLGRVEFRQ